MDRYRLAKVPNDLVSLTNNTTQLGETQKLRNKSSLLRSPVLNLALLSSSSQNAKQPNIFKKNAEKPLNFNIRKDQEKLKKCLKIAEKKKLSQEAMLKESNENVRNLVEKLEASQNECETLKIKLNDKERETTLLNHEVTSIVKELEKAKEELKKYDERLISCEKFKTDLNAFNDELTSYVKNLASDYESLESTGANKINGLENLTKKLTIEKDALVTQFKKEKDHLINNMEDLKKTSSSYAVKNELLNTELLEVNQQLKMSNEERETLRQLLNEGNIGYTTLTEEFKIFKESASMETIEKNSKVQEINDKLAFNIERLNASTVENDALKREISNLCTIRDSLSTEIDNFTVERNHLSDENEKLKTESNTLAVVKENIQTERDHLKINEDNLLLEMEQLKIELNKLKVKVDDMKLENSQLHALSDHFKNDYDELNIENKEFKEENDLLMTKISQLNVENDQLMAKIEQLQTNYNQLKLKNEQFKLENEQFKLENEQFKLENEQIKLEIEQLKLEKEQLKIDYDQLKIGYDQLKIGYDQLKIENEQLKIGNGQIKVENEHTKIENEKLKIDHEQLMIENEQLKIGNEQLKVENGYIKIENEKLKIDHEQLKIENEQLKIDDEQLKIGNGQMKVENEQMKIENEKLKIDYEQLKVEYEQLKIDNERINVENEESNMEKSRWSAENIPLNCENDQLMKENEQLKIENKKINAENEHIKTTNDELITKIYQLELETGDRDQLNAENESLNIENDEFEFGNFKTDSHRSRKLYIVEQLKEEIDQLKKVNDQLTYENSQLKAENNQSKEVAVFNISETGAGILMERQDRAIGEEIRERILETDFANKLKEYKIKILKATKKIQKLKDVIEDNYVKAEKDCKHLRNQIENLRMDIQQEVQEKVDLKQTNENLKKEINQIKLIELCTEQTVCDKEKIIDDLTVKLAENDSKLEGEIKKNAEAVYKMNILEKQNLLLEAEKVETVCKVNKLEKQNSTLKTEKVTLDQKLEDAEKQVQNLLNQNDSKNKSLLIKDCIGGLNTKPIIKAPNSATKDSVSSSISNTVKKSVSFSDLTFGSSYSTDTSTECLEVETISDGRSPPRILLRPRNKSIGIITKFPDSPSLKNKGLGDEDAINLNSTKNAGLSPKESRPKKFFKNLSNTFKGNCNSKATGSQMLTYSGSAFDFPEDGLENEENVFQPAKKFKN